jgi:hypothetical protein
MTTVSLDSLALRIDARFGRLATRQSEVNEETLKYVLYEEFSFSFTLSQRRSNVGVIHNLPGARQQTLLGQRVAFNGQDEATIEMMLDRVDAYCRTRLSQAALEYFDAEN